MKYVSALLLSVLLAALAGCGAAGKAAEDAAAAAAQRAIEQTTGVSVDQKNNSVTIKGQDGKQMTITANEEGKLPEGFPIPVFQGGKVTASATMNTDNKKSWTAEIEFEATAKAVGDYYEKMIKERGMKVTRSDSTDGGFTSVTLVAESDKESAFLTINQGEKEPAVLTLMWGNK